jgi:diamine N-acetyltransferase
MWALDTEEGSHWIGGVVVDAAHQGRGVGRATVLALLELFEGLGGYREAALSVAHDNTAAAALYRSLGFVPSGELVDDELVMRRPRR